MCVATPPSTCLRVPSLWRRLKLDLHARRTAAEAPNALEMAGRQVRGHAFSNFPRLAVALILSVVPVGAIVDENTRYLLVALYAETHGAEWNGQYSPTHAGNTNWLTGDPCIDNWAGLACIAGSVQSL